MLLDFKWLIYMTGKMFFLDKVYKLNEECRNKKEIKKKKRKEYLYKNNDKNKILRIGSLEHINYDLS